MHVNMLQAIKFCAFQDMELQVQQRNTEHQRTIAEMQERLQV